MSICILTTYYNPTNSKLYLDNFYNFVDNIKKQDMVNDLYVCEIGNSETKTLNNIANHYYVRNNTVLWHKENGINYLLKNIPNKYNKIIVSDNDIIFDNSDWISITSELLDTHMLVQPFEYVKYLGPESYIIDTIETSISKNIELNNKQYIGNPGLCVAYRKEYLDSVGGLFDLCLMGGADTINMIPFIPEYVPLDIFDRVCHDHRLYVLNYIQRAMLFLKTSPIKHKTFINNSIINHLFHGWKLYRKSSGRYDIIKDINFSDFFTKNSDGFIELIDNPFGSSKQTEILEFFESRQKSESILSEPLIINTNKYSVDNNILWLSDHNVLTFKNIDYIEICLKQTQQLKYLQIIANNNIINYNFIDNTYILKINNPKSIVIDADSFVPYEMFTGEDKRKLSVFISEINVIRSDNKTMERYDLEKIM